MKGSVNVFAEIPLWDMVLLFQVTENHSGHCSHGMYTLRKHHLQWMLVKWTVLSSCSCCLSHLKKWHVLEYICHVALCRFYLGLTGYWVWGVRVHWASLNCAGRLFLSHLPCVGSREAARECRRKKKEYVKCLENRVAVLENQNKTLIEELKALKDLYCHKAE